MLVRNNHIRNVEKGYGMRFWNVQLTDARIVQNALHGTLFAIKGPMFGTLQPVDITELGGASLIPISCSGAVRPGSATGLGTAGMPPPGSR